MTFFKNENFHFYCSRELSVFGGFIKEKSVRKQCWFFSFCVYKIVMRNKFIFVFEWRLQLFPLEKDNVHVYIYTKNNTLCQTFLYTKSQTRFKNQDNLRYVLIYKKQYTLRHAIFHENVEVGIYIQKSWHFAPCDVLIYKEPDTLQKPKQFALRLYIQKAIHFTLREFSWKCWSWHLYTKSMTLSFTWGFL